jgi:hypothetical protein
VKLRGLLRRDFPSAGHVQRDLVREPVRAEVHRNGQDKAHDHALGAAEHLAHQDQDAGQRSQQQDRFDAI